MVRNKRSWLILPHLQVYFGSIDWIIIHLGWLQWQWDIRLFDARRGEPIPLTPDKKALRVKDAAFDALIAMAERVLADPNVHPIEQLFAIHVKGLSSAAIAIVEWHPEEEEEEDEHSASGT